MHKKMPTVLFQNSIWLVCTWPFTDYFWREGWRGSPSSVSFSDENWAGNWGLVQRENRSQTLSSGATKREITAWKRHSLPSRRKGRNLSRTLQLKSLTDPFTAQITTSVKLSSNKGRGKAHLHIPPQFLTTRAKTELVPQMLLSHLNFHIIEEWMHKSGPVTQSTSLNLRTKIIYTQSLYKHDLYPRIKLLSAHWMFTLLNGFICQAVSKSKISV